jgi:hypothetical protein
MQTIITKAGRELGIKPIPSKRVRYDYALLFSLCDFLIHLILLEFAAG